MPRDLDEALPQPWPETALSLVLRHASALGASAPRLKLESERTLRGGAVLRLRQVHRGLPVVGGEAVLHLRGGRAVALGGRLHRLPGTAGSAFAGLLDRAGAERALRRALPGAKVQHAALAFWPGPVPEAQPVWRLHVLREHPLGLLEVLLSARGGQRLWQRPAWRAVQGRVYSNSPLLGQLEVQPLLGLTDAGRLQGEHADVQSCWLGSVGLTCQRRAGPDAAGDYLFQPQEPSFEDPFAEVQAYYHVDRFHRWLAERFGFERASGHPVQVLVNFGVWSEAGTLEGVDNSFFGDLDGDQQGDLVFGQSQRDIAYDADAIYHEFTHSVVAETSRLAPEPDQLGLNLMPLSLDEGFADLMSCSFSDDPVVAEYAAGSSLRDLRGPDRCPDQLTGEPHRDGLIWSRALWSLREKASDRQLLETLIYQTLIGLPSSASLAEAAALLLKLAQSADPDLHQIVTAELSSRGLLDCSRLIPLRPGSPRAGQIPGSGAYGLEKVPAAFQYRLEVPAGAALLRLAITREGGGSPLVYYRRGEPVRFLAEQATKDGEKPEGTAELVLKPGEAGQPGGSYFLLPLNTSPAAMTYTITLEPSEAPVLDSGTDSEASLDAGGSATAADRSAPGAASGCSCTLRTPLAEASRGLPIGVAAALLLLAVLLFRRRLR